MSVIGVRELRQRTAEVLKSVREEKAEYIITHQGHPVAMLLPVDAEAMEAAMVEAGKKTVVSGGVPGRQLLRFGGAIPQRETEVMRQAIEQGCEQVDVNEW